MRVYLLVVFLLSAGCSFLTPQKFDSVIQEKVTDLLADTGHMEGACNLLMSIPPTATEEQVRRNGVFSAALNIRYKHHWLDPYIKYSENKEFNQLWKNVGDLVEHVYEHPGDTPKACTGSARDLAATYESVLQVMGKRK